MICKFLLIFSLVSKDSLPPPKDSLFASLKKFHIEKMQADLSEFDIKKVETKKWEEALKWMPQVGTSYNLLTDKVRPTVGYNFNQIYSNIKEKKKAQTDEALRLAKIEKILRGADLDFKRDSFALVALLKQLKTYEREMINIEAQMTIDYELFDEQKKRYDDGLIKPIDWLKIQKEKAAMSEPYYLKLEQIDLLIIRIFELAKL